MKNYRRITSALLMCTSVFNGRTLALNKNEISKNNAKVSAVSSKNHLNKIKKYGILGGIGAIIVAGIVITTLCVLKIKNKKNSDDDNMTKANNIEILLEKFSKAQGMNDEIWNKFKDKLKSILINVVNGECSVNKQFEQDYKPIFKLLKGENSLEGCSVNNNSDVTLGLAFKVSGQSYNLIIEENGFQFLLNGTILIFKN